MNTYIVEGQKRLPKEVCASIIEQFNDCDKLEEGVTSGGVNHDFKHSIDADVVHSLDEDTTTQVRQYINHLIDDYGEQCLMHEGTQLLECGEFIFGKMQLQKYIKKLGHYKGNHVEEKGPTTVLGVGILYLNDVADGGKTVFPKLGVEVLPEQGKLVMFPPFFTHLHHGEMPLSDDKYIITFTFEMKK